MKPIASLLAAAAAACLLPSRGSCADDWEWWVDLPVSASLAPGLEFNAVGSLKFRDDMSYLYNRGAIAGPLFSPWKWLGLGLDYWYRETRKSTQGPWTDQRSLVGRFDLRWKAADWLIAQDLNRLEYDTDLCRWRIRIKPRICLPFRAAGLAFRALVDNEFFLFLDYPGGRTTYSENRFSVGLILSAFAGLDVQVGYRRVDTDTDKGWRGSNVLYSCMKIAF
ncbi:MAG TPA: DUF2490 domain-containing protein [bacterium]|nr:DUF2490 domain-containing protein [bacterium]HPJ71811.1 DUF2490 domain-containing protein [bacterium]HPQ66394.1 DUF2490 domain-containing protein [bacterium]